MLYAILALVGVLAIAFVLLVLSRPADFRIVRSAAFSAPPAAAFALVNDFHRWDGWSPWAKLDPAMKATFDGPASGAGAKYAWSGNGKVGEGRMTILESREPELVKIKLEFLKPFAATNIAEFAFVPEGRGTRVTWAMAGRNDSFVKKAFCLFMNMDRMVGRDFEKGLAAMKALAESAA